MTDEPGVRPESEGRGRSRQRGRDRPREEKSPFQVASEAAESWLNTVYGIAGYGRIGNFDVAYGLLLPTPATEGCSLQESFQEHASLLSSMSNRLAAVSDGPIDWANRGLRAIAKLPAAMYPHVWSSAHEAASGLAALALNLLAAPVAGITDPREQWDTAEHFLTSRWKALDMPMEEVARLQERVRRERAKVLVSSEHASMLDTLQQRDQQAHLAESNTLAGSSTVSPPQPPRLTVDLLSKTATLDGTRYDVHSERALRWLRVLVGQSPNWVSGSDLTRYDPDLTDPNTHKYKKYLPQLVRDLITSRPGSGSCIPLQPQQGRK